MCLLNDANSFCGQPSLLQETQDVDTRASSKGCQESRKGRRRRSFSASQRGLVRVYRKRSEVGVYTRSSGKGDFYKIISIYS